MINKPFISIVMPVFNTQKYIERALKSCINQTLCDIEILVVDDRGSDDSIKIATEFAKNDPRIKIIQNPKNLGLFSARLNGERHARGEYILPLDSDDYIRLDACKILKNFVLKGAVNNNSLTLIKNTLVAGGGGANDLL